MKNKILAILTFSTFLSFSSFAEDEIKEGTGSIHILVEGVDEIEGQIGILLFDNKEGFPTERSKAFKEVLIPLEEKRLEFSFHDLPYGNYAIAIMHDDNMNDVLDSNIFGIPKEGVGTSNNVKTFMRAPRFDEAMIVLDQPSMNTTIIINY